MSANERSGWRDASLSLRRRWYGPDVPVQDIDDIWIEFDRCQPVALIEYKATDALKTSWQVDVLVRLAAPRTDELPAFGVRYWSEPEFRFKVWPLNGSARARLPSVTNMSEFQFASFEYALTETRHAAGCQRLVTAAPGWRLWAQ